MFSREYMVDDPFDLGESLIEPPQLTSRGRLSPNKSIALLGPGEDIFMSPDELEEEGVFDREGNLLVSDAELMQLGELAGWNPFKGLRRIASKVGKTVFKPWTAIRRTSFMRKMGKSRFGKWMKQPFRLIRQPKRLLGVAGLTSEGRKRWMKGIGKVGTLGVLALKPKYRKKAAIGIGAAAAIAVTGGMAAGALPGLTGAFGTMMGSIGTGLSTAGSWIGTTATAIGSKLMTGASFIGKGIGFVAPKIGSKLMTGAKWVGKNGLDVAEMGMDYLTNQQGMAQAQAEAQMQAYGAGVEPMPADMAAYINQQRPGIFDEMQANMFGGGSPAALIFVLLAGTAAALYFGGEQKPKRRRIERR